MYYKSKRNSEERLSHLQHRFYESMTDRLVIGQGVLNEEGSQIYKLVAFRLVDHNPVYQAAVHYS